jgi:hypothetical protein
MTVIEVLTKGMALQTWRRLLATGILRILIFLALIDLQSVWIALYECTVVTSKIRDGLQANMLRIVFRSSSMSVEMVGRMIVTSLWDKVGLFGIGIDLYSQ